ncbi:MAG: hypothetical protein ABI969_13920, partial [bacterium]
VATVVALDDHRTIPGLAIAAPDASAATAVSWVDCPGVSVVGVPETIFGHTVHEVEIVFGLLVLIPIVLAATRSLWRRGASTPAPHTFEGGARFDRLEQAVESIAIEVERISEAQRFAAKLLAERHEPTPERLREPSRPQRRVATPIP